MITAPCSKPKTEVDIEKQHLLEDLHVIKYNMANALLALQQYEQSIYLYGEVLELLKQKRDKRSQKRTISCFKKLGVGYSKINMIQEALQYFQKGLDEMLSDKALSQDQKTLIFFYDQMASLYVKKHLYKDAIRCYSESLRLKTDYYGVDHEQTAHAFISLG